jgi:hypothetical protein
MEARMTEDLKTLLKDVPLGIWADIPKQMLLTKEFFDWYQGVLGFDFLQVMIDAADSAPAYSFTPKDVETLVKLAEPGAIDAGLVTWPYPTKAHLDLMKTRMNVLLDAGGGRIAEWETDQEGNWKPSLVAGFAPVGGRSAYDLAGDYLVSIKEELCHKHHCDSTITTFTEHMENSPKADTTPGMDLERVQAYAIRERDKQPVAFDSQYGPGQMQRWTLDKAMTIPAIKSGRVKLSVGHAAWMQNFAGHTPVQAMETSLRASVPYSPADHCWWSLKFVYPKSELFNTYALAFLKTLRTH